MLKADVWRDQLIREESILNARLAELEQQGDDKRFEDAKEEASSRLAEVHASLSEMDAASGPARAASLLAGTSLSLHATYPMLMVRKGLGFSEEDRRSTSLLMAKRLTLKSRRGETMRFDYTSE